MCLAPSKPKCLYEHQHSSNIFPFQTRNLPMVTMLHPCVWVKISPIFYEKYMAARKEKGDLLGMYVFRISTPTIVCNNYIQCIFKLLQKQSLKKKGSTIGSQLYLAPTQTFLLDLDTC